MKTGRQTLGDIEDALGELHAEEGRLDGALASAGEKVEQLRQDRATALRELARVKLDEITAGRLVRNLDAAERRAVQILEEGQLKLAAIAERRQATLGEIKAAETAWHAAAAEVEAALEALEALRAEVESRVRATAEWKAAQSENEAAHRIASEAEKKAASSEAELGAKKKPYDADPLFIYLWDRGFGTQRYVAGNFTRMMDRMVASHIGFIENRPNYAMLIEIPLRLREHARGRRTLADETRNKVAELERRALAAAGSDAKEKALAAARHRLAAADQSVEAKRQILKDVEGQHARLIDSGPESAYASAIETIASGDSTDDIATLYREARRTATPADEALVQRIEQIDATLGETDREVRELRRSAKALADRRLQLEDVRERFRNAGYDHPHATFGNDSEIARALRELLRGAVQSGLVWDLIRAGFRYRAMRGRPDFGAPQFPFPFPIPGGGDGPRGGGWREPTTRGGWSPPFEFPSSGSGSSSNSDSGDFSTGGSF
jgi:hypothetical protein